MPSCRQRSTSGVSITTAVHVARGLVDAGLDASTADLDLDYLEAIDLAGRVPVWAELASRADL